MKLTKCLEEKEDIILAFIFGSEIKGQRGEESDLDIRVYLKDENKEDEIWSEISKVTGCDVDLVLLNNAPATLISSIFKTGIPLVIKDRKLYTSLYLTKSLEAEDFHEFAEKYWEICSMSKSMTPEDRARLIKRIEFLRSEFQ